MDSDHAHHSIDSPLQTLKDVSLRASGYAFLMGDAALFAAGVREDNLKAASAGLFWAIGGLTAARYGNPNQEKQLEILTTRLGDYLRAQHIAIPREPTTALLRQEHGVLDHVEAFLYKHPADILNTLSLFGAAQLIRSGTGKSFTPDIASGIMIGAGGLAGLLIQEKKPDPLNPPQGAVQKALSWAQERPLRITGGLQAINNVSMFWASHAMRKLHPEQKSYALRFASAASYLFANIMLSVSSKENDRITHPEVMLRLADMTARVIAAQPVQTQEHLLQEVSAYLAQQPGNPDAGEISALLHRKLQALPEALAPSGASWQARMTAPPVAQAETLW